MIMKKALIVGINYYQRSSLYGCVNDALEVSRVLSENYDHTKNFDIKLMTSMCVEEKILKKQLKDSVIELFEDDVDIALFYFSGHGFIDNYGGYLVTSECEEGDSGLSLFELMQIVDTSKARNKIVIIDSCHSGFAGKYNKNSSQSILSEGVTILTASSESQYAIEQNGSGVFTSLLVDALEGGAANLVGEISPGSIYAHIDQSLGAWQQRPIFKTNVTNFTTLRKVKPPIELQDLKQITSFFAIAESEFKLDPTFEPERNDSQRKKYPDPIEANTKKFAVLQKYNRINLLTPVDAPHMWHAAMYSKSCRLTMLGRHYWRLVKQGKL